jgi:hypothetical protein
MKAVLYIIACILTILALIHFYCIHSLFSLVLAVMIDVVILVPKSIRKPILFCIFAVFSNPFVFLIIIGLITKQLILLF